MNETLTLDTGGAALPPAAPTFRAALRHRDFALLWAGQSLSAVGNMMLPVALAFLVLNRGGGPPPWGWCWGCRPPPSPPAPSWPPPWATAGAARG
uniref:Uncharacterized protein n=1 Tax=uncultured bacterium AB_1383 TaxID=1630010 RepID=A0A0E3M270_9BACT|nr:hypothetical protein [uncultured bacterium AB_1383]